MTRQTTTQIKHVSLAAANRPAREIARLAANDIDMSPEYQRGSVWTEDQRIALIRSWLQGVPIPAIILNDRFWGPWPKDNNRMPVGGYGFAVVDGKQRIETAVAWFDDELAVPASWFDPEWLSETTETDDGPYVTYTGLTPAGQRLMANRAMLPTVEARLGSLRDEADLYLLINGGGTPQSEQDMDNARAWAAEPASLNHSPC